MTITMVMAVIFLQAGANNPMVSMLFMVAMIGVFYFFMVRPQMKKQKEQTTFQESILKGAQVVTSSGIHGKIEKVEDSIVTLQVDTKTYLKFEKSAISKDLTEASYGGTKGS